MKLQFICLVTVVLLTACWTAQSSSAAAFPAVRVTSDSAQSVHPKAAVGDSGIFIVWEDFRDGNAEVYWQRYDQATLRPKTPALRLTATEAPSAMPAVGVDSLGISTVVWQEGLPTGRVLGVRLNSTGEIITGPLPLSPDSCRHPDIAVESTGDITIVYQLVTPQCEWVFLSKLTPSLSKTCTSEWGKWLSGIDRRPVVASFSGVAYMGFCDYWLTYTALVRNTCGLHAGGSANVGYDDVCVDESTLGTAAGASKGGDVFCIDASPSRRRINDSVGTASHGNTAVDAPNPWFVWQDTRDGNTEIYLSEGMLQEDFPDIRVTEDSALSEEPDIATFQYTPGKWWIVWQDNRDGNWEVYLTASHVITSCCEGTRGNVDVKGIIDLSDLSTLILHLTSGGIELPCPEAANIDGLGITDLSDLSTLIQFLVVPDPPPLPECP